MIPSRVIAVDWSGARTGAERKIWLAEVRDGHVIRLRNGRSREAVTQELVESAHNAAQRGERLVIGLDFGFGFPAWYARRNGWRDARDTWRAFPPSRVDRLLREPEFPFWGRGRQRTRPPELGSALLPALRATERETAGPRAFSVFQLIGAGAVGTATLRGMATLDMLAEAGACIWPFMNDAGNAGAVVIEIWPRVFAPRVNKSSADARVMHARGLRAWTRSVDAFETQLAQSDDAFDAFVSACTMWESRAQLALLPVARDVEQRIEGCIWRPDTASVATAVATSPAVRDESSPPRD